jgi:serine/threonine protein kinase/tetratricopeptide (TPR) repeat protein
VQGDAATVISPPAGIDAGEAPTTSGTPVLPSEAPTTFGAPVLPSEAPTTFGPPLGASEAPTTFATHPPGEAPTTFAAPLPAGEAPTTFGESPTTMQTPSPGTAPAVGPAGELGPLKLGEQFGRYTIIKMLGMGGMGAVYQAWDKELEVVVALKVIRPEALRDPAAEQEIERRFKRELLLARQVTHKNVVRIHDLGEIRGIKYITMSYVNGTDLSTVIRKEGRLPVPKVLRVMRAVVSGLVAAHGAGVVHRDLKPANIMIDAEGEALIMDFGIARSTGGPAEVAVPRPKGAPGAHLTGPHTTGRYTEATMLGTVVGTVEYMSPEQARGEAVDQRSDIYTTGLILYDLLSGKRRAEGPGSAVEKLRARMEGPLPALESIAPDVPAALVAIVTRATDPDVAKRFQTTTELAAALEGLDENGVPLPVKRAISLPVMAAIVVVLVGLSAGTLWYMKGLKPEKPPDPVSVVIADFDNRSGDPAFDRTLEPMLRRALEGAGFITAYDRNGIRRIVGAALPAKLDEAAAGDIAVKQGLGVVLTGAIEKQGAAYTVSMKATKPVTGTVLSEGKAKASGQDQVIATATTLVTAVRKALGDHTTSASDQIFAMTSLSASSLEVVRHYSAAQEAASNGKNEDARLGLLKAVELDPKFGVGYLALSGVYRNLGKLPEAQNAITEALSHLDGMTERERYTTRGMSYRLSGDYQKCVDEHTELIKRYKADVIGHNQLALCASQLRDLTRATTEMQAVVDILPKQVFFRDNLALYSDYLGDFPKGESEAKEAMGISATDAPARLALAFAQLGQGQLSDAKTTFTEMAKTGPVGPKGEIGPILGSRGPTWSASGLGDMAVYEGRFAEAVRLLDQGAAADLAGGFADRAAAKFAEQAYAQILRGQKAAAVAAAEKALANSKAVKIRFLAARTFVDAGQTAKAEPLMKALAAELQPEPQAYGKMIEAQIVMAGKDARPAIKLLTEANALLDTWIGHFELGRAYLAADQFLPADSEFDRCTKRRGEALALFLDEEPTYGYFPMVYYYQGRVREGQKLATGAAESYRAYLALREKAGEDPLLADVRRRVSK